MTAEVSTAILFGAAGTLVIIFTTVDFIWTTLSVQGAGPMTARLSAVTWAGLRAIAHGRMAPVLAAAGPMILVVTLACWILLLWLGWLLIFLAEDGSVVRSQTEQPADLAGRAYFVGFAFSTLGVGDLIPQGRL